MKATEKINQPVQLSQGLDDDSSRREVINSPHNQNFLRKLWFLLLIDRMMGWLHLPVVFLVSILKGIYVLFCLVCWAFIAWVLGDKHIGVLKCLILSCGCLIWLLIISIFSKFSMF